MDDMIQAAGAHLLFLPPHSPDRAGVGQTEGPAPKAAERSVEGLWTTIDKLLAAFTLAECANYIANAGYDAT